MLERILFVPHGALKFDNMGKYDIAVIGAGIVGCITALELKRTFPERTVVVIERNSSEFQEASRYNSGVIHSGIHHRKNSLKLKLSIEGGPLIVEFCQTRGVPLRKTGMLIAVASRDLFGLIREARSLVRLLANARCQHIPVRFVGSRGIKAIEPNVRALFGMYLPEIWIVDQIALGKKLVEEGRKAGVEFLFHSEVQAIQKGGDTYEIIAGETRVTAGAVINAAGVQGDMVAAMAGNPRYKIYPYRGEYYEVVGAKKDLLKNALVYPALPPGSPVKGAHLVKTIDGRLLIGPNAKPWPLRHDDFSVHTPAKEFVEAAKKFLPELEAGNLRWSHSGLRAKTSASDEGDFIIKREDGEPSFINIIGIDSPGFTAAFAIAREVAEIFANTHWK